MDGGKSPLLIAPNQYAFGINLSVRGGFARTRPPRKKLFIRFASDAVESRFTGKFQGACPYESSFGDDSFIISRGGKLFRMILDGDIGTVSEITPQLSIVTTADFTVPAVNNQVTIPVVSEVVLSVGQMVFIDSGQYEIVNRFVGNIIAEYQGGAAHATVASGAPVLGASNVPIVETRPNPDYYELIFPFQAENYVISLADNQKPVIFDGATTFFPGTTQVPSGQIGAYGMGRVWVVLNDGKTFRGGDLVFGSSGTIQAGYRDAILYFTENDFLNEGGDFQVRVFGSPYTAGDINALQFIATQDTSLGLGPLAVSCGNMVFTVDAPTDRTVWKNLSYPIKTIALLNDGATGPRSIASVNSDIWYRSKDGITSFIQARRNFDNTTAPANTPNSREVSPILDNDDINLLYYGSFMEFDNRLYCTVAPQRTTNGIIHKGIVDINFDLISDLRQKLSPAWEGLQTGLDVFQLVKGRFDGVERGFAFADNDGELELWEFVTGSDDITNDGSAISYVPIKCSLDSRSLTGGMPFQLKQIDTLELFFDEIDGTDIPVTVKFRPDQYPDWIDWHNFTLCSPVKNCADTTCPTGQPGVRQYAARITLPKPPETCNNIQNITMNRGYSFQIRLEWTGCLRLKQARVGMLVRAEKMQGECPGEATCQVFKSCTPEWFDYNSHGT